jgi:hypothetical protein
LRCEAREDQGLVVAPFFEAVLEDVDCCCVPVLEVASMEDDWLPVVAEPSMFTVERPRASIVGLTFEVDPVIDELTPVELPACVLLVPLLVLEFAVLEGEDVDDAEVESATQSWWTALLDLSPARPASFDASLPAFFLPSSLQSGLVAVGVPVVAPAVVPVVFLAVGVCAKAGAAAISEAATREASWWLLFMVISPVVWMRRLDAMPAAALPRWSIFRSRPTGAWMHLYDAVARPPRIGDENGATNADCPIG